MVLRYLHLLDPEKSPIENLCRRLDAAHQGALGSRLESAAPRFAAAPHLSQLGVLRALRRALRAELSEVDAMGQWKMCNLVMDIIEYYMEYYMEYYGIYMV